MSAMSPLQLRVVAYCRVSSDKDEQENSLESQMEYYAELIDSRPDWVCAGILSDSTSGRSTKKRLAFGKLMDLC